MNPQDRRRWLLHWLSAVLLSALTVFVLWSALKPWDLRLRDGWFRDDSRQVQLSPQIRLVLIDDKSLTHLHAPTAFWAVHLSRAAASLLNAGAAVVGIDYLPYDMDAQAFPALAPLFPELSAAGDNPWLPLFEALQAHGQERLVQGIYPPNLQKEVDPRPEGANAQYRPAAELMAMLGPQQLGFMNLSRDRDGVLRRQTVVPLKLQRPLWGASSFPPFAARVAEVATGETMEPGKTTWKGAPLPLLDDGTVRVNYPPTPGLVPSTSLSDVLQRDPQRLHDEFAGKIVLIGPGTGVFQDKVATPVGEMFGVEAHAYLINTLITGQFLQDPGDAVTVGLCAAMLGLGASFGLGLAGPVGLIVTGLLATAYGLGVQFAFLRAQLFAPVVGPVVCIWLAWALGAAFRARLKAEHERHVRHLFGRYVSPSVMEVLLKDPSQAALGAVAKRQITVLFSDINGFSTHCEKKSPEQIMAMLNRYFESMNQLIFRHGGTIKQFVGDEIMAMYGAPLDHASPEVAAVTTAVEMVEHLERLHRDDPEEAHGFYRIKVGIHCGQVIVGNVGSLERTEYAAVGDDVNLGSRIMGMTKALKGDILISKDVYEKVRHLEGLEFLPKGSHPVKGRVEPVEIFEVRRADKEGPTA